VNIPRALRTRLDDNNAAPTSSVVRSELVTFSNWNDPEMKFLKRLTFIVMRKLASKMFSTGGGLN
jgi:hypothetical protein